MATEQLEAFLRKKSESQENTIARWEARRIEYMEAVERLYDTIEQVYLNIPDRDRLLRIDRSEGAAITEPYLGPYAVFRLRLFIAAEMVEFIPRGVVVANSAGRIDVIGHAGETTLSRVEGDQWEMIYTRTPKLLTVPLTERTFLDLLRRVMD